MKMAKYDQIDTLFLLLISIDFFALKTLAVKFLNIEGMSLNFES